MRMVCNQSTTKKDIVKLVRKVMIEQDCKRSDIAERLGGYAAATYNLLNPDHKPDTTITVDTLIKLCDAMDCDLVLDIVGRGDSDR